MNEHSTRLEEAWLAESGAIPTFDRTIHPGDELYHWERSKGRSEDVLRAHYFASGHETLRYVEAACQAAGKPLTDQSRILEFASGFGRVTRHLVQRVEPKKVWTSEILDGAEQFSAEHFGVHAFGSTPDPANLDFDVEFDLIFVVSLFSHLPAESYKRFLRRLYELLAPDGVLVYSTHGPSVLPDLELDERGFGFRSESETLSLDMDDYGTTAISISCAEAFAREVGIEHHASLERGIWNFQDLHVASRRALPSLENWKLAPIVRGVFERSTCREDRIVEIGGWVRWPVTAPDLASVELVMDGRLRVPAELHPVTRELDTYAGGAAQRQVDWIVSGPLDDSPPGDYPLVAVAELVDGTRFAFAVSNLSVTS